MGVEELIFAKQIFECLEESKCKLLAFCGPNLFLLLPPQVAGEPLGGRAAADSSLHPSGNPCGQPQVCAEPE